MAETIQAENAQAVFEDKARRWPGPWPTALEALIPLAHQSHRDNFTSSATPEGADWPPRKVEGDGHPLLIDTGNMLQASTGGGPGGVARIEGDTLFMGVSLDVIPYARAHNMGNPERNLPRREFLGLTLRRAQEGETIVADKVEPAIFGA